jgi:hypothetical protein
MTTNAKRFESAVEAIMAATNGDERQPMLPGSLPPFDPRDALDRILELRGQVRRASAAAEEAHRAYTAAKKAADGAQQQLSQLEDDYEIRRRAPYDGMPLPPLADHDPPEMGAEETVALCAKAGATITVADVEGWTVPQVHDAHTWALQQIDADQTARPHTRVSVRWPDHVSAAHHRQLVIEAGRNALEASVPDPMPRRRKARS